MRTGWRVFRFLVLTICLFSLLAGTTPQSVLAASKFARLDPIGNAARKTLRPPTRRQQALTTAADTCAVSPNSEITHIIGGWVTGQELYKCYIDPGTTCPNPYPYKVTEINMPMSFTGATPLVVSVDIETVDNTSYPGCNIPGQTVAISKDWELNVPTGGGMFDIWIPLDTPIIVNGPFFAGFFISNSLDASVEPSVLSDNTPDSCVTFNIWDQQIGWVDLTNNEFFNFPGNLAFEVAGIPGGSTGGGGTKPAPQALFVSPQTGRDAFGNIELWAADTAGATIKEMIFAYSFAGGNFIEIGRDFDGFVPARGKGAATTGNGYTANWNVTGLAEGSYILRATAVDSSNRQSVVTTTVNLEPTPPVPVITSPDNEDIFCSPLNVTVTCSDNDVTFVEVYRKAAANTFHSSLTPFSQFAVGDANGNANDGNFSSNGEFGDYYSAPVAAASLLQWWANRGYATVAQQGASSLSTAQLSELLATSFRTRADLGTRDHNVLLGLGKHLSDRGNVLQTDYRRTPTYLNLRTWLEEEERTVMIGLSGSYGFWLALEGFNGFRQSNDQFMVYVMSPLTGAIEELPIREIGGVSEIFWQSAWQKIDIMISLIPTSWNVTRALLGADLNGTNGWSLSWQPTGLTEGNRYFIRAVARDNTNKRGYGTIMTKYQCTGVYAAGDLNGDATNDLLDLLLLISFVTESGPAPSGGAFRGDTNCDNVVNIADVVYYMNFLFGAAAVPCR